MIIFWNPFFSVLLMNVNTTSSVLDYLFYNAVELNKSHFACFLLSRHGSHSWDEAQIWHAVYQRIHWGALPVSYTGTAECPAQNNGRRNTLWVQNSERSAGSDWEKNFRVTNMPSVRHVCVKLLSDNFKYLGCPQWSKSVRRTAQVQTWTTSWWERKVCQIEIRHTVFSRPSSLPGRATCSNGSFYFSGFYGAEVQVWSRR